MWGGVPLSAVYCLGVGYLYCVGWGTYCVGWSTYVCRVLSAVGVPILCGVEYLCLPCIVWGWGTYCVGWSTFVCRVVNGDKEDLQCVAGLRKVVVLEVFVAVEPAEGVGLVREVDDENSAVGWPLRQVLFVYIDLSESIGIITRKFIIIFHCITRLI